MVKKKVKCKKSVKKKVGMGYTQEIVRSVGKVKKLFKKKDSAEKRYKDSKETYSSNKEKLMGNLKRSKEKKEKEKKNLTKLIGFLRKKK